MKLGKKKIKEIEKAIRNAFHEVVNKYYPELVKNRPEEWDNVDKEIYESLMAFEDVATKNVLRVLDADIIENFQSGTEYLCIKDHLVTIKENPLNAFAIFKDETYTYITNAINRALFKDSDGTIFNIPKKVALEIFRKR